MVLAKWIASRCAAKDALHNVVIIISQYVKLIASGQFSQTQSHIIIMTHKRRTEGLKTYVHAGACTCTYQPCMVHTTVVVVVIGLTLS